MHVAEQHVECLRVARRREHCRLEVTDVDRDVSTTSEEAEHYAFESTRDH